PAVGFAYRRFHIFFCDLWTWDGRYVLYENKRYWVLQPEGVQMVFGKPEGKVGKPFLYRFPLGLLILAGVAAFSGLLSLWKTDADRAKQLLQDPKYQHALKVVSQDHSTSLPSSVFFRPGHSEEPSLAPEQRFSAAVDSILSEGVRREQAEKNVRLLQAQLSQSPGADPFRELVPDAPTLPIHPCFTFLYQPESVLLVRTTAEALTEYGKEIDRLLETFA